MDSAVFDNLTTTRWDEFNERIANGAMLVVVSHFVIDISLFTASHPGGSMILKRADGTDITDDLLGLRHDVDASDALKKPRLRRQGSIANNLLDRMESYSRRASRNIWRL
ncbi:hypothetical protein BC936DRAFT_149892 [Jimgerdemannia flammicorona]|uniref:Cytochrome b5 heme-binding domain-containing protein n=1 Tax=Jimgerdemannia flammicorona TaxID=994334 RepID=A0A433CZZ1_9FUNG|nr:hypothetical protein BC936DRAFT_149892 [Jimgerdemannia flammicorona]